MSNFQNFESYAEFLAAQQAAIAQKIADEEKIPKVKE